MDKRQEIINEYLLGKVGYRVLSKKYGISRSAINRWALESRRPLKSSPEIEQIVK